LILEKKRRGANRLSEIMIDVFVEKFIERESMGSRKRK